LEAVFLSLRADILSGAQEGGAPLPRDMIIGRDNVRENPVREARRRVAIEEPVVPRPRQVAVIMQVSGAGIWRRTAMSTLLRVGEASGLGRALREHAAIWKACIDRNVLRALAARRKRIETTKKEVAAYLRRKALREVMTPT
jgi:DNA-binding GntR family transcriptional regulator